MLGYNDLLRRPSIGMNTIWEQIIKKKLDEKMFLKFHLDHLSFILLIVNVNFSNLFLKL